MKDHAQGKVLREYTDELLGDPDQSIFKGEVRELLLLAPAGQRQNVAAEQTARMFETVSTFDHKSGMYRSEHRPRKGSKSPAETLRDILAENGWLP